MSPSRGVFWLFATTALASSFVLFSIEPLLAKLLLPWFGGVPAVSHAVHERVAVVGLGTGTYLSDAFPGLRSVRIELGDARLGIARSHDRYAVIVIDAFSSDAIPVHLLTTEAMRTYADHLADDGLLAIHCSNNTPWRCARSGQLAQAWTDDASSVVPFLR